MKTKQRGEGFQKADFFIFYFFCRGRGLVDFDAIVKSNANRWCWPSHITHTILRKKQKNCNPVHFWKQRLRQNRLCQKKKTSDFWNHSPYFPPPIVSSTTADLPHCEMTSSTTAGKGAACSASLIDSGNPFTTYFTHATASNANVSAQHRRQRKRQGRHADGQGFTLSVSE